MQALFLQIYAKLNAETHSLGLWEKDQAHRRMPMHKSARITKYMVFVKKNNHFPMLQNKRNINL